ncbi:hypothetical protein SEPCBS119000_003143 [Sporothrix epigloea]|uniref:Myb-like domain-containing protein n=1 Tax=Sporothrix epigloea TaxID=1892477 RepID=A0ABP0DNH1_9PEZI
MTLDRPFGTSHDFNASPELSFQEHITSYYYQFDRSHSLSGPADAGKVAFNYHQVPDAIPSPAATASVMTPLADRLPQTLGAAAHATAVNGNNPLRRPSRLATKNKRLSTDTASTTLRTPTPYAVEPLAMPTLPSTSASSTPRPLSNGAWRPQDDDALLQARSRGENWAQIQAHFPGKTPNACRKRHERLVERRNASNNVDACKMAQIAREYMQMRRDLWQPLALRTGEKWTVVEARCMGAGLKNLQGVARSANRRLRSESRPGPLPNNALLDTSGMPPDDDDLPYDTTLGDAPQVLASHRGNTAGSGGTHRSASAGSGRSSGCSPRRQVHPQSSYARDIIGLPSTYSDYYATTAGFSQSLRTFGAVAVNGGEFDSNGNNNGMANPSMGHHRGQQLPSESGADSLLHWR